MKRSLQTEVRSRANGRCEYCRLPDHLDPIPFQADHIIAEQHGGETTLLNLAWACLHCNQHKGPNIAGIDPVSKNLAPLFHPRRQSWERHFHWDGPLLRGRTQSARATIQVLAINDDVSIDQRAGLIEEGLI